MGVQARGGKIAAGLSFPYVRLVQVKLIADGFFCSVPPLLGRANAE